MQKKTQLIFATFFGLFFGLQNLAQAQYLSRQDINLQFQKSTAFMLENMRRPDAVSGVVIAAPSRNSPDYFFHWVRDAALTTDAALSVYQSSQSSPSLRQKLQDFFFKHLGLNEILQQNILKSTASLGEPKFDVDGSIYPGPWGRPQNDGPGLRSSSMIRLLHLAQEENWPQAEELEKRIYTSILPTQSVAKLDLEFIAHHWQEPSFDLWEEIFGYHFYTLLAQRQAMASGQQVASSLQDPGAAQFYREQYELMTNQLQKFWDSERGFLVVTRGINVGFTFAKRSINKMGLDSAVILAVLHSGSNDGDFSVVDERVQATYQKLRNVFTAIYPINNKNDLAPAFGRYPEDTYDGYTTEGQGNPWVLATAGSAEFLYRSVSQIARQGQIAVTAVNAEFLNKTGGMARLKAGQNLVRGSKEFQSLLNNLFSEADRSLARVLYHKNDDGSLSEQINLQSGYMQGAPNLTWSHASFLTAKLYRDQALNVMK